MTNNINYSKTFTSGYDRQTITITDLLSEGPIQGLVNGRAGVFLNNDRIVSIEEAGRQYNKSALTISLTNGSNQATINNSVHSQPIKVETNSIHAGIRGLWIRAAATKEVVVTVIKEPSSPDHLQVVTSDGSNFFTASMSTNVYSTGHQYTPVRLIPITGTSQTVDSIPFEGRLFEIVSDTKAKLFPSANGIATGAILDNGTYTINVDFFVALSASSGTTLTLAQNWAGDTDEYKFDDNGLLVQQGGAGVFPGTSVRVGDSYNQKYESAQVGFRTGTADQAPLPGQGGDGSVTIQNNIGHTIELGENFSGSQAPLVLTASSAGAAGFNLSAAQRLEVDELRIFFDYPGGFKRVDSKGRDKFTYQVYKISIAVKRPGESSFEATQVVDLNYAHSGTYNNAVTFIKSIELDRYRPFTDFQIKIERQTAHNGAAYYDTVASRKRYHNDTNVTTGTVKQVVSVIKERLNYPYSSIAKVAFSSKQFQNLPQRTYHLQGIRLKVPKNYVTREEAEDGVAGYYRKSDGTLDANKVYQDWDGSFREGLIYSNNPAWILNDIVTNNRYGLGDFVSQFDVDKYSLYRIARYCDELVDDGKGGLEPRYTLNTYFTKSVQAYKVLKDLLTNFLSMIYYIDGQILAIQDAPTGPVYTFSKANIMNGTFQYESTGSQTRINQVIVTWNNPDNNYELEPLLIEDRVNIVTSGKIISQDAVAFGCTSEGQAIRYGRWKLWTAANQTEVVSFQTGINASFLIPGDVINVQDADRDAVRYAGRISSSTTPTTTQVSIDSPITLNAGSSYELSVIVAQPGAFLQQDSVVIGTEVNATTMSNGTYYMIETLGDTTDFPGAITNTVGEVFQATGSATGSGTVISGTRYLRGALISEGFTGSGSSAVAITTKEIAANLRSSAQGSFININWNEEFKVETQAVTTSAGAVSALTVGNAFSVAPLVEDMWVLTETLNGVLVAGSPKKYKIIAISQSEENKYTIQGVEYYDEKFDSIEKDFTTYIPSIVYPEVKSTDVVPSPIEVAASTTTEGNSNITISWKPPLAIASTEALYEHTAGYQITHDIPEIVSPININEKDKLQETIFNVPEGTYVICVKTLNILGNFSTPVNVAVEVVRQTESDGGSFPEGAVFGGQFNRSIKINSSTGLFEVINSTYNFSPKQAYSTGIINTSTADGTFKQATNGIPRTSSTTVDPGTFLQNHHYLIMDASDAGDRIKLIKQYKDDVHKIAYWYDTGSGESGTPTILNTTQALSGNATKPVGSKKVTGVGTAFTTEYKIGSVFVMPAANSEFVTGRVNFIESDTVLDLDNISEADATTAAVPRTSNFTIDNANDCIIGKVYKDTSDVYHFYSYASITSSMEILGIESSSKSGTTTTVNLTDGTNIQLEDGAAGTAGNNVIVAYASDANGTSASFTPSASLTFVKYHEYTGTAPAIGDNVFNSGFVQFIGNDGTLQGVIAVFADDAIGTNKAFAQGTKKFVNFYEWTGTKPAITDSTITALNTFVKIKGDDAISGEMSAPAIVLQAATSGAVSSFSGTGNVIKVFEGSTALEPLLSNATVATGQFIITTAASTGVTNYNTGQANCYTRDASAKTATFGNIPGITSAVDSGTITYTIAGKTSTNVTFAFDKVQTISKSKEGTSTVQAELSNDNHTVTANNDGTVPSGGFTGTGTELRVFEGDTALDFNSNGSVAGTFAISVAATNVTAGSSTVSGSAPSRFASFGNISAMSADIGTIVFTITGKKADGTAFTSFTVQQSFSKSKVGATGAAGADFATGIAYEINADQAQAGSLNSLKVGTTQHSSAISAFFSAERVARWASAQGSGYTFSGGSGTSPNGQWALGVLQAMSVTGVINTGDSLTISSSSLMAGLSLAPFSITRIWIGAQIPANANIASSTYATAAASGWSTAVVKQFAGSVIVDGTLKADSLIADDTFTQNLNIGTGGVITLTGTTGKIVQGKTSFSTAAAGFFLGMDGGTPKFRVGNSDNSKSLSWNGSVLTIQGRLQGGDITSTAIPTGTNKGYYLDDDGYFFVGNASKHFTVDPDAGIAVYKGLNFTDIQGELTGLTLFNPADNTNLGNTNTFNYTVGTIPTATTAYKPKVDVQFTIQNSSSANTSAEFGYKVVLQLKNESGSSAVSSTTIITGVTSIPGITFKSIVLPGYLSKSGNHSAVTGLQSGDTFQISSGPSHTITSNSYYSAADTTYIYYTGVNIAASTNNTLSTVATAAADFVNVAEIFISPFSYLAQNSGFISGVLNSASTNATVARLQISRLSVTNFGNSSLSSTAIRNVTGTGEQIR